MEKLGLKKIQNSKRTFFSRLATSFKMVLRMVRGESHSTSNLHVSLIKLPYTSFNCEAYVLAKRRMNEIEGQKALAILESRHERWKGAGGPN